MNRAFHFGRAAVVLVALAIIAGGVHFLHAFQVRRTASALKDQAMAAEQVGDHAKASEYLGRYLGLHPDDGDALAEYGLVIDKQAEAAKSGRLKLRAFLILSQAMRRTNRDDLRRPLAMLAVQMGRTSEARDYLNDLLARSSPHDAELEDLLGRCDEADGKYDDAAKDYQQAITDGPKRVETYVRLAVVLRRRLASPKQARDVMDQMVAKNPASFEALLARGRYLREAGLLADGARDIALARQKLAPDATEVLLASADVEQENGDAAAARRDLETGLQAHLDEARFHLGLAALDLRAGPEHRKAALQHLKDAETLLAGQTEGLWSVADLYLDAGETEKAEEVLASLTEGGASAATDYLQARLDFNQGKFGPAAALLEQRRPALTASEALTRQTDLLLGQCYRNLGDPDLQLAVFRRAVVDSPSWTPALLGRASALLAVGKTEEALVDYNDLVKHSPHVLEARLQAARLLIFRTLQLPADQRDWSAAETLLKETPEDQQKSADVRLARIDLLIARGRLPEAHEQLEQALNAEPKEVRYWLVLARLADREAGKDAAKDPTKSLEVLDRAEQALRKASGGALADSVQVDLRLARAGRILRLAPDAGVKRLHLEPVGRPDGVHFRLAPNEVVERLRPLEKGADAFDAPERARLWAGLMEAYQRAGAATDALRLCKQAHELSPNDLVLMLRLFDLSSETAAADALKGPVKDLVDDIREREGTDGATWRCCEATRLILLARAKQGDARGLSDARALLTAAARRRPSWLRPPLLEAQVEELADDTDAALTDYRQAIDLGERRPEAIGRAAALLIRAGRPLEAKQVLEKLGDDAAQLDTGLGRLATVASLLGGDLKERTLKLATAAAGKDVHDYRGRLWFGEVCWAAGDRGQAEAAFRQALADKPTGPEAWKALLLCLVDEGRKDQAGAELDNARKALPADQAADVLAVGYEALGRRDQAEEQYLAALKAQPAAASLRDAAAFYLRGGDVKKAEPLLLRLIEDEGRGDPYAVAWGRRSLALAWASTGDFKQSQAALDLLDENLRSHKTPEDQRARALVLASRAGGRREAIQELEASFTVKRPTPDEEFLLARLYEANGEWGQANQHYLSVVGSKAANPLHLAYYVTALLRHNDVKGAARYLQDLEQADPDSLRTAAAKARVLHAQGDDPSAVRTVVKRAEDFFAKKKDPAVLGEAAVLLEQLGQNDKAEEFYRNYVAAVEDQHPEKRIVLAAFLARRDRLSESLDLIDAIWDKLSPKRAAREEVAALRVGRPTPALFRRVQSRVEDAVRANPGETDLLVSLADLQDAQGRYAEAINSYRAILAADPRNRLALNNLAWLLAFKGGKPAESVELVGRAMEIAGPTGSMLDTKGMALLKAGHAAEAARVLSQAVDQLPTATLYFHLAEAQKAAAGDRPSDADRSWRKAVELGLKETDLHPLERADFRRWLADHKGS